MELEIISDRMIFQFLGAFIIMIITYYVLTRYTIIKPRVYIVVVNEYQIRHLYNIFALFQTIRSSLLHCIRKMSIIQARQ